MIKVKFKYRNKKEVIECGQEEKVIDVCKKFTTHIETELETKTIYFNGDKVEVDSNETFFEIITNNPEDEKKYKIDLYDNDSQPKLIVNIEGKKIITRAKKGDTYKSVFERMKINFNNFFFLKQGSALQSEDLERRLSIKG